MNEALLMAARAVTGGAFLVIGIRNIGNHPVVTDMMRARGVPLPALSAGVGIGMQIGLGGLMITGIFPAVAALGLAAFVVMATAIAHWPFDKAGEERQANISACLVNAIMLGGLLALAAAGGMNL
ncbi:putative oxidoreductase [Caulobacter ginsengisoli]|uniref:Oxidoreductase n=1 Tax=Caulobacter ginsengisoli TaxID=400775 RepID=A0ABU0ISQ6_9CAUL|nr:DoxX family protein [Caulobacter ginsengisoli]MDQ0464203.1 putative oxidoreductase [Caulobacter ginsengisoli]